MAYCPQFKLGTRQSYLEEEVMKHDNKWNLNPKSPGKSFAKSLPNHQETALYLVWTEQRIRWCSLRSFWCHLQSSTKTLFSFQLGPILSPQFTVQGENGEGPSERPWAWWDIPWWIFLRSQNSNSCHFILHPNDWLEKQSQKEYSR